MNWSHSRRTKNQLFSGFLFALFFALLVFLPNLPASAKPLFKFHSHTFPCGEGYKSDSYGRGLEAGFRSLTNLRPKKLDEECYQRGLRDGIDTHQNSQVFDCLGDFDHGYAEGLKSSALSAGTACWSTGYTSGIAALHVGAREGDQALVGEKCLREYGRGFQDGNANNGYVSLPEEPAASCYSTGYYDGDAARAGF